MKLSHVIATLILLISGFAIGYFVSPGGHQHGGMSMPESQPSSAEVWYCPMDPEVRADEPGRCPICGMDLIPKTGGEDLGPRRIAMSPESAKLAEVVTALVERRYVSAPVRLVGKVDYDETRVKTISAWIPSGRIERQFVDYTGVPVQAGEHLVLVYSPDLLTAQQELLEAARAVEENQAQSSEFLRASDMRRLESTREKLRLWGLTTEQVHGIEERGTAEDRVLITSPTSGIVIHKGLQEGDYVQTGTPIYRIADLDFVWVRLDAYESDLHWIRYGQRVRIEAEAFRGELIEGRITFISPVLDEATRTVSVRVNVDNHDRRLKPGMFVRATVDAELGRGGKVMDPELAGKFICPMHPEVVEDEPGMCRGCGMATVSAEKLGYVLAKQRPIAPLVVPASAVLLTGKRGVVYVEVSGTARPTYEGREVVLGPRAGPDYVVLAGLEEGERVVVNGNFKIDSAMQIEAKASMMSMRSESPLAGPGLVAFRRALAPFYAAYFEAQDAFASDDGIRAQTALRRIAEILPEITKAQPDRAADAWSALASDVEEHAAQGGDAASIDEARKAFRDLSATTLEVERTFGHSGTEAFVEMYCSMAFSSGASWLQNSESLRNPFYGASMLECGEARERFLGTGEVR